MGPCTARLLDCRLIYKFGFTGIQAIRCDTKLQLEGKKKIDETKLN